MNVRLRQVNFLDGLKRKRRTENTLFGHMHNTSPISNAETSRSGLEIRISNKSFVLDVVMFVMDLRRMNCFENIKNILHATLKEQVPNCLNLRLKNSIENILII